MAANRGHCTRVRAAGAVAAKSVQTHAGVGERLAALLEPIGDLDRLEMVGGWIIGGKKPSELLARREMSSAWRDAVEVIRIACSFPHRH